MIYFDKFLVDVTLLKHLDPDEAVFFADGGIGKFLGIFSLDLVLLDSQPVATFFLEDLIPLFEQRMKTHLRSILF